MTLLNVSALDFRLGVRMLRRYPWITAIGTLAMAVGIALGMLYFEALNKVLHPVLPVPGGDRIVTIRNFDMSRLEAEARSLHDFAVWRTQVKTIDHLGAAQAFSRNLVTSDRRVEPVSGVEITANAFTMMGTLPLLGRTLSARDEQPGQPLAVVIGERLWTTRFGRDPSVIGQPVTIGATPATVVGVMPEWFGFPVNQHLWLPMRTDGSLLAPRTGPAVSFFGRLAPGASMPQAQAELDVIARRLAAQAPEAYKNLQPRVATYGAPPIEDPGARVVVKVVYTANLVFVLLLSVICTNVATLVFARTATRGWEVAVRNALGASRRRIIAQLFSEALVLAAVAAGLGILLAKLALRWGLRIAGDVVPFWVNDSLSATTVLYAGLLTLVAAAIVGVLPALRVTRLNVQDSLRREQAASASLRFGGVWTTVIVVQVAITVALLPLAAVLVTASNRFAQRAAGVDADRYLAAAVTFDSPGQDATAAESPAGLARRAERVSELERRLRAEPGVEQVAFADRLPVMDTSKYGVEVDKATAVPLTGLRYGTLTHVSSGYFAAFGTRVIAGRDFSPVDFERHNVLIVNQSFTHFVFGGRNPVGQRIRIIHGEIGYPPDDGWYEIVGMVRDFGWQMPEPGEQAAIYLPGLPPPGAPLNVAIRRHDPLEFAPRVRVIANAVDPTLSLTDVQLLGYVGGPGASLTWAVTSAVSAVAFLILLLSASGIHALMSFIVARRTRDIGIRVALGSPPARIVSGIFARAFLQVALGVIAGSALVALKIDFNSPTQVLYLVGADTIMLVAGVAACVLPLRRALAINPTEALRAEA